ncbi:MAG TPA: TIGR02757 family protein, partial [Saprospiraceae bacterium]|nr:TIGR02757 family protein [Saprospiraceae bacterium]
NDPISIPHQYSKLQDIEITGFWTSMLSWGNRKNIISSCTKLFSFMDNSPYQFIKEHNEIERRVFEKFVHRTFNYTDTLYFIEFLQHYYQSHESMEDLFFEPMEQDAQNTESGLIGFHNSFFDHPFATQRTKKHVSSPLRKSTCKRLNMFLRWMVRNDDNGVDFGIWKKIKPAQLLMPLDVHVDRVARKFNLITRKQTDWQTVIELTENVRIMDPLDPVKYDYALFGIGIMDKTKLVKPI